MELTNNELTYQQKYRKTKRGHLVNALGNLKTRAKNQKVPCDITLEYLESIAGDECPIFKTPFVWGQGNAATDQTPSLDKVIPELGYVKHNVVFISFRANKIKQDVTEKELYAVADWLHEKRKEVLNAEKNTTTPVPERTYIQGELYPELGSIPATGPGEDDNDAHHHCGADARKDTDHSTQASSGDGVGRGGEEVGTSLTSFRFENYGVSCPAVEKFIAAGGHLPDKS